jgi:hypothetical protein
MSKTQVPIDIGIPEGERKEIAGGLGRLWADTYTPDPRKNRVDAQQPVGVIVSE